jgi:hypothetical protein
MWRVFPNGLLTWAPGGGDGVCVHINSGEKEAITALASMTAAHDKLPLFLIAEGKTAMSNEVSWGRQMTVASRTHLLAGPQSQCFTNILPGSETIPRIKIHPLALDVI